MEITEVVETAHEVHTGRERFWATSQSTSAADQVIQAHMEGGIELSITHNFQVCMGGGIG